MKKCTSIWAASVFCLVSLTGSAADLSEWLLGKWIAQSRGTVAVHGDMEITKDKIHWQRHGWVKYRLVSETEASVLLELERRVDCAKAIRLGPYARYGDALQMSEYASLEDATSEGSDLWKSGACGWGWYHRRPK